MYLSMLPYQSSVLSIEAFGRRLPYISIVIDHGSILRLPTCRRARHWTARRNDREPHVAHKAFPERPDVTGEAVEEAAAPV